MRTETRESASCRPSVCMAIPALTACLGSVTDTLDYNRDCAYANEFPVAVEDPDVGKLRTIAQEAIGLMVGVNVTLAGRLSEIRTQNGHVYG